MSLLPSRALVGAVVVSLAPATAGGDDWVRVRSPRFEVLSDAGAAPAREAARRLEHLRAVLRRLLPVPRELERPITLVAVESRSLFSTLIPRERARGEGLGGFFQGGDERDYAVLHFSPSRLRPFEAAEHEYAHLVLNSSLPAQPVWVAEGLAELFSDAVIEGDKARLGFGRPDYERILRGQPDGVLEGLLAARYDSPAYRGEVGEGETDRLYAGAWALARWVVHRRGLPGLRTYLLALAGGTEPEAAFEALYGPLERAEATLLDVPDGPLFRVSPEAVPDPPLATDIPSTADIQQRLGDLLLSGGHTSAARRRFERALAADSDHAPSRTSLGGLLVRQGEWDAARVQLERALEVQPENPAALLRLARLEVGRALMRGAPLAPETEARVVASLEVALAGAPEMIDAALLLAALRPQPYAPHIDRLEPLFEQQPDRTEIARALSGLYLKLGDVARARRVLERAREAARDAASRYLAEHLLERVEGFKDQTAEARGDLIHVKCRPDGSLLFTISADPHNLKLEAASTTSFFIHGPDGLGAEARLLCGEQDRPVVVRYEPGGQSEPGVTGTILWLNFEGDSPPLLTP